MRTYTISCESTADVPYAHLKSRGIPVLFYSCTINGVTYEDNMSRDPEAIPNFYRLLSEGYMPTTSQLNAFQYEEFFTQILEETEGDILHLVMSSGLTSSLQNARSAAEALQETYPDREVIVIDTLCGCAGYGMLVDYAADQRDAGMSLDDLTNWVYDNRLTIQHHFYSTELEYFKRSGRLSGPFASIASILGICPVMKLDEEGRLFAHAKARNRVKALQMTLDKMEALADNGTEYDGKCYICHSNCLPEAEKMRAAIEKRFPKLQGKITMNDVGMIVASHCGPGTVVIFFKGAPRVEGQ